ncbi:protease pro-enzyme activation domain-containing protein [Streptomyces sp. NPDC001852]|uniref:protease pro-enzyme activation domain-containing protein n=1 Tax=Streptomyces sp. NPDC001852 TaxID=3364619 RepID=UPI0036BBAD7B
MSAEGLTRVDISRGRDYVSATGPVSTARSAFRVRINRYRTEDANGTPTVVQSNDRDVSVPASLAPDVLGVTGMSGARPATSRSTTVREGPGRPLAAAPAPTCSRYWAQHTHTLAPAYRGKRLERGGPAPGETMETAAQAQYEVWEMLRAMRTAMRHDLGVSHED